ncbi:MAG: hypothetical protein JWM11_4680 [Planctomycetaceae bacterium]|nr:hypothetical protein [Planctomycetaceae bacterium]
MARSAQEFITFVANHFRLLDAMCRERRHFSSDDDIVAFLRQFENEDKNLTRLINRMREIGVLVETTGEWAAPAFLVEFIAKLFERHVLASPKVIQGWIETLRSHVSALCDQIAASQLPLCETVVDAIRFRLQEIEDVFQTIIRTVQENCDRIGAEVVGYRQLEDQKSLRNRLNRLITLHDEYLEPVIRILDINEDFYSVTEQVATCCDRIVEVDDINSLGLNEQARFIHREVICLRRAVVRRAEEARRELSPLCEAAVRESRIAIGVARALEAIRLMQWQRLALESDLQIIEERDRLLCGDRAIERYLRQALQIKPRKLPRVAISSPEILQLSVSAEDLVDRLSDVASIDDLLGWVLLTCDDVNVDSVIRLFHAIIELRPVQAQPTEDQVDYEHCDFLVRANRWTWKGMRNGA